MMIFESFNDDVEFHLDHLVDDGFTVQKSEDYVRIFKPISDEIYSYSNLKPFNFDLISDDVYRYLSFVTNSEYSIDCIYVIYKVYGETKRQMIDDISSLENKMIMAIVICVK